MDENFKTQEITDEVINTFLNGHNPMERIVNLDYNYKDDFMSVYYRDKNDNRQVLKDP